MNILSYFPYPRFRPHQKRVLLELEQWWDSFLYFALEAPTGFGKSAEAIALARWIRREEDEYTHIVVNDIYLQEQYTNDFKDIVLVKGRGNFKCPYDPLGDVTCA